MHMTIRNAIDEYLVEQQIRGNSPRTQAYYRHNLGRFCDFLGGGARELHTLGIADCREYYLSLSGNERLSSVTVQTYIRAVRAFLSWCYGESYLETDLTDKFRLPKAKKVTIDVLTDDEIARLFAAFDLRTLTGARNFCICALMYDSGLRLNEVVTLKCGNIHVAEGYVIVDGKGNKQRFVPLGLQSKKALIRYVSRVGAGADKAHLFVKDSLTPIQRSTVRQVFRRLKIETGIARLKPHLLRHTFATRYLQYGGDIYSLQQILGHTSLEMVRKYVHLIPEKLLVSFSPHSPLDNILKAKKSQ